MNTLRPRARLQAGPRSASTPPAETVGPRAALAHQLALSVCMLLGILVVEDQVLGTAWLYWVGQAAIHSLTLGLIGGLLLSAAGIERPVWGERLLVLLPVLDLLVLAVCRWSVVNAAGFQGFLMAVPMVWLAARYRFRGVAFGIGICVISMVLGLLMSPDPDVVGLLSRGLVTAVLAGAMALVVAGVVVRLAEQRRRLETVSSALGVVSIVLDQDGEVVEEEGLLGGAARGRSARDLLADPVFSDTGRSPLPTERNPLTRAARGADLDGEAVWTTDDGGRRIALSVSSTRLDETRMLVVVHDVTASLAAVLQEEQFLANVSHELKTPLTSITGYVELIEDETSAPDGGDPDLIRSHLAVVSRNVVRLQQLILGLLETARAVSGEKIGSRSGAARATSLDELVRQQVETVRPRAAARRVRFALHGLEKPLELVNADPERLGQALDNVLSNAVKYAHEGGLVTVELGVEDGTARLAVIDEGIGIDADDLAKLFTPYFRARTATEAGVAGYGLGLMITRRILRAHGGDLAVSSQAGVGTRVELVLPLART
ncbi:HAMP domain-containing sensor histidine kinase [Brachybacterium sp.]|uniref:sensor histidine kinase n=1 Tax=Brachybacterium sp. TaxID=1891286 RepID=UPI002ED1B52A